MTAVPEAVGAAAPGAGAPVALDTIPGKVPPPSPYGSIPLPTTREQVKLLLLRWNALYGQNMREDTHAEMREISRALKLLSSAQHRFEARQAQLHEALKTRPSGKEPARFDLLRAQIQSFKLLSRNMDIPPELQYTLLDSLKYTSYAEGRPSDEQDTGNDDGEAQYAEDEYVDFPTRQRKILRSEYTRELQSVTGTAETVIKNRISHRVAELERLPANLGTIDTREIDFLPEDAVGSKEDMLKTRALVELKSLRLLTKQKSMRQHVVYSLGAKADSQSVSMTVRALNRRTKVHTAQELRLAEQLERQQRLERERRERVARAVHVHMVTSHVSRVREATQQRRVRHAMLSRSILQLHGQIEREESKRAEKTAKQRLLALRSNDEEAYIKLLDQTKDTRITHLLRQTNSFLDSLAQAVRVQQQSDGLVIPEPEDEEAREKVDYYEVAHRVKESVEKQPSILVGGTLKEYQIKGLQWMVSLYNNNLNGILADEMGLGKTIQSISLIAYLIEAKRQPGPYLVIVPLSTLTNWTLEFEKWAPSIKKVVYKGPPNARKAQQGIIRMGDFQVLLTTYEYIIKDRPILSKIKWTHMIIDEGHRMKNAQSKLSITLVQYYYSRHRLILTGTPLQNNLPELWALLNFVLPKIFNSVKTFDEWFNTPFANTGGQDKMELTEEETLLIIRRLHKVLRPFLLRRLKKDVEKDLPDKVEKVVKCKMSAIQAKLYDQMLKHNVLFIGQQDKSKMSIKGLNNRIMQLRKICNHPFVFEEVENIINPTRASSDMLWRVGGKFELLDRIFPKFLRTGHRVLIFFQMTQVMDIMEDYMRLRGLQYLRLDGSTKADERSELLKLFNAPDSPYFCFLLSTRAGGLGLNLQTADTVIIYDTDWNPHQDLQAQDRAHRIGQTKEVRILRLITEDSVEEAILERAHAKLEIDGKVIQAGKFDNKSTSEEQEAFLRSLLEAEDVRRDQHDEDDDMDDEELNEILARSEAERELFKEIDEERIANSPYGRGKEAGERLFGEDELPEAYKRDIKEHLEPRGKGEALGRGARERKAVFYDDGLTEEQWLEAVDNDEDSVENAIERARGRRQRRQARKESKLNEDEDEDEDDDGDDTQTPQPKRRNRGSRASSAVKDEEYEDNEENEDERPSKRNRAVRAKDPLLAEEREALTEQSNAIYEAVADAEDETGRSRSEIFLALPPKSVYPDYYQLITDPISLEQISQGIDDSAYTSLEEVKTAFDLMFSNAKTYNEPGSAVYEDAEALEAIAEAKYAEQSKPKGPVLKLKLSR